MKSFGLAIIIYNYIPIGKDKKIGLDSFLREKLSL
jgi:hypothetical protein